MTPPAATAAARTHARPGSSTAPRAPRRVSGPARTPSRNAPLVAGPGGAALAPPLGLRLARALAALPDARVLDRLSRGRLWIGILAVGLVGIVFLQISLLKLNTGISRAVETGQTLERQNTALKSELSALAGGERIQESAAAMGFVLPATGQPRFLDARKANASAAAAGITKPAPIQQLPLGMIPPAEGGTAGIAPDPVAPAAAEPTAAAAPASAGAATSPAAQPVVAATAQTATGAAAAAPAAVPPPVAAAPVAATAAAPVAAAPTAPAAGGATAAPQG